MVKVCDNKHGHDARNMYAAYVIQKKNLHNISCAVYNFYIGSLRELIMGHHYCYQNTLTTKGQLNVEQLVIAFCRRTLETSVAIMLNFNYTLKRICRPLDDAFNEHGRFVSCLTFRHHACVTAAAAARYALHAIILCGHNDDAVCLGGLHA